MITQIRPYVSPAIVGFCAVNLGKIITRLPQMGTSNTGGVSSNGDFRPISRYITETVQDREIVTMEL